MSSSTTLHWKENPHALGATHMWIDGRKKSIGGISEIIDRAGAVKVRGYFLGEQVYEGESKEQARAAVEKAFRQLPANIVNGLLD